MYLTLTSVVFELISFIIGNYSTSYLTLTRVVFEYDVDGEEGKIFDDLTLTRVVFESCCYRGWYASSFI